MAAFHLNNREAKRELKVYNNDRFLPFCPTPTYLGVKLDISLTFRHHLMTLFKKLYIDDKMNWSYHINHLTQHLRKSIGLICKIRHYINEKTTRMLYYALVYSHLQYGITSWGFADVFT